MCKIRKIEKDNVQKIINEYYSNDKCLKGETKVIKRKTVKQF